LTSAEKPYTAAGTPPANWMATGSI
jgi:hypothetical protein